MEKIILYTTHCPRCLVLKKKLEVKNIPFEECEDIETMKKLGISSVPVLNIDNKMMDFSAANKWINTIKE